MVGHIVSALRQSPVVKDLEVMALIEEERVQFLRAKAEMLDGSLLYVRELFLRDQSKYSYHWQTPRERCCCAGTTLHIILRFRRFRTTSTKGNASALLYLADRTPQIRYRDWRP
jgi:hypothetical protein